MREHVDKRNEILSKKNSKNLLLLRRRNESKRKKFYQSKKNVMKNLKRFDKNF